MSLGKRIKQRREELKISQDELASLLGYTSRSSISKIEADINDLTQTKIVAFAEALHTTPEYLMEWTDDPIDYPDNIDHDLLEQTNGNVSAARKLQYERDKSEFNKRIEYARTRVGLTKDELYDVNVPIKNGTKFSDIEYFDDSAFDEEQIDFYAKKLNVSTEWLIYGTGSIDRDEGMALYNSLDANDKAEIRGEMKQMLRAEKYKQDNAELA